jgi:hypothetical protein
MLLWEYEAAGAFVGWLAAASNVIDDEMCVSDCVEHEMKGLFFI